MPADDLEPGDFVYHRKSGTARLLGLNEREVDGKSVSYFELEFAGGDKILVPVDRIDLLEKIPKRGDVRIDRLRQAGGPPPPPRALVLDRANRMSGGSGLSDGDAPASDPLLGAAQRATPERRQAVEQARQNWMARLIDVSRRNRLLYFQP